MDYNAETGGWNDFDGSGKYAINTPCMWSEAPFEEVNTWRKEVFKKLEKEGVEVDRCVSW